MEKRYDIFQLEINGERKEFQPINGKNPQQMAEGFKSAWGLQTGVGAWEMFFYAESKMNKRTNKEF